MITYTRRIALLTGASVLTMGLAVPAFAQSTTVSPGILHVDTTDPVEDVITICDLDDSCFFGVEATGTGVVGAFVTDVPTGQIEQHGIAATGVVDLAIVNDGSANIGAHASAEGATVAVGTLIATGYASANAFVATAISQTGSGPDDVNLDIANNGTLVIDALAAASGATAIADADVAFGIYQQGDSTGGDVAATMTNDGPLSVNASAAAAGSNIAVADASITSAAMAQVATAFDGGNASVAMANSDLLTISAIANATGAGTAAFADARLFGAYQFANAVGGGNATASFSNAGTVSVTASANAAGGSTASASASVQTGLRQFAGAFGGGDATVALTNSGSMGVAANAAAIASVTAVADASLTGGIYQTAVANTTGTGTALEPSGNASVSLVNDAAGVIDIAANADANAGSFAAASASVQSGIFQGAFVADGDATVDLANAGAISIGASANAGGVTGTTATADGGTETIAIGATSAFANASVSDGILQVATDFGATGGLMTANIDNSGTIDVFASASASGTGVANAAASVDGGIVQFGFGNDVALSLTNSTIAGTGTGETATGTEIGTINISAVANAAGATAAGFTTAVVGTGADQVVTMTPLPGAVAQIASAILQSASGTGTITTTADGALEMVPASIDMAIANSGAINIAGTANATATGTAMASAAVNDAIAQRGSADGGDVSASIDNSGSISITANANASGANANGVGTIVTGTATDTQTTVNFAAGPGAQAAINGGIMQSGTAAGVEMVLGTTETAEGGIADVTGIMGGNVALDLTNSGSIDIAASAAASGSSANASAAVNVGIGQFGLGSVALLPPATGTGTTPAAVPLPASVVASANVTNDGSISIAANASAAGQSMATANADVLGIVQSLMGTAIGTTGTGTGTAPASGVSLANAGSISVSAIANAVAPAVTATGTGTETTLATQTTGAALANAGAVGLVQISNLPVSFTNSGTYDVLASANASGIATANANATATGVIQTGNEASFANSGTYVVQAVANAVAIPFATATGTGTDAGTTATTAGTGLGAAFASANGYVLNGIDPTAIGGGVLTAGTPGPLAVAITNSGTMSVSATAVSPGTATAVAHGIVVNNAPTVTITTVTGTTVTDGGATVPTTETVTTVAGNPVSGTITNSGTLTVVASAAGGVATGTTVVGTGTTAATETTTTPLSSAVATGIQINGGANTMTVANSGTLSVDAITANGGNADATGVRVTANGDVTPGEGDVFVLINDGGAVIVRQSADGGETWQRGMAFDLAAAPNNSVVNLLGDGEIYGNIDVQDGDVINVEDGSTVFDGIINPEFMPVGGVTAANLDTGLAGEGMLNIQNGGNLVLVSGNADAAMDDGPSYAFVDELNVGADGTLTYNFEPTAGGAQPVGSYPQLFANTANLDGSLVANIDTTNILPEDSFLFNNVIDAVARNGQFDSCSVNFNGVDFTNSVLTDFGCVYDDAANVDLAFERVAFNEVAGLTANQLTVATAIENVYSPTLTGPFGTLLTQMFTFEDAGEFGSALDQLSGVEYPNYLHAVRNNSFVLNSFVSDQLDCAVNVRGIDSCRDPEHRGRVWAMGTYNSAELDSNSNAIGYDADNWSAMLGGDVQLGNFLLGAFAGYRDLSVDFPDAIVGSGIDSNGWQIGVDAAYDVGSFYVRGVGSYSWLDGDSERRISIGSVSGTLNGDPDVNVLSLYGEAGARLFMAESTWLTPFVAIDHTSMKLKDFSENGGIGADLDFDSQSEDQTSGVIGLKLAGNWGGIVPEAKIAYRHDFNDGLGVDMRFAGINGSDFRKVEDYDRNSWIAGLSLAGALGSNLTGRLGYQGRFNSDVKDHAIYGSLALLFGGAAPPPPPPPPPPEPERG